MQIDSGADCSIVRDRGIIENYKQYNEPHFLTTISGDKLKILGEGQIGDLPVRYSENAEIGLMAVKDLQRKNLAVYFPPGTDKGCEVINPTTNEIVMKGDEDYITNLADKPDFGEVRDVNVERIHTVTSKKTIDRRELSFLIPDLQRRYGYKSLDALLGVARCTEGFPYSEAQIRRHFVQFPAYYMGRCVRSSSPDTHTIREAPLEIGSVVSTDCMEITGGGSGVQGVQLFVDRKSLYVFVLFTAGPGTSDTLAECVIKVLAEYRKYGHSIQAISGDSLPAYQSIRFETVLDNEGIRREETAPYEHKGVLAERIVRICSEQVTAMRAAAPWVPDKLICFMIMLWAHYWNCEEGGKVGVSRSEEFKGIRPAANANAMTGVLGDCYIINLCKEQRSGGRFSSVQLQLHGKPAMYIMPNEQSKDGHWFYDPITDKVVSRRSFRRVPGIPSEWMDLNMKPGLVTSDSGKIYDFTHGPLGYDVWRKGAHPEVIAHEAWEPDQPLGGQGGEELKTYKSLIESPGVLTPVNDHRNEINRLITRSRTLHRLWSRSIKGKVPISENGLTTINEKGKVPISEKGKVPMHENGLTTINEKGKIPISERGLAVVDDRRLTSRNVKGKVPISENGLIISFESNAIDGEKHRIVTASTVRIIHVPSLNIVKTHGNKTKQINHGTDNPTLNNALKSQDADKWVDAIDAEYHQLEQQHTWEAVSHIPYGMPLVPSHLVLVKQRYATGEVKKYKARLVANGSRQQLLQYQDSSSPTARETSVKLFYAKAAAMSRIITTFDVKGAYLKSDIDEEIYMLLPRRHTADAPEYVRLLKSIYGLKQAGKLWYENIRAVLIKDGFSQSTGDECVFRKDDMDVVIHVDDILASTTERKSVDLLLSMLNNAYGEVRETTSTGTHLGIHWEVVGKGDIKISQPGYIHKILTDLGMEDCNPELVPYAAIQDRVMDPAIILKEHYETRTAELRKILGLLNHAAVHTRPDILSSVAYLQTKIAVATDAHIESAKKIVRYLKGTQTLGLIFAKDASLRVEAFVDAARDLSNSDSRGHSGISVRLGSNKSAAFHFSSKKQTLVTRSVNEAEIFAIDSSCIDIEWIREMLKFLGCEQEGPTVIHEDNEAAIEMLQGRTKLGTKSRHIKWRYNYALQAINEKSVMITWISTSHQIADILTKNSFVNKQFYYLRSELLNCFNSKSGYP
jgi:Reverse transcriptase (RNA-dependent DNA polymerase)